MSKESLLFPFQERYSRTEILLIQFENVLANTNYLIIKNMLKNYDNWIKRYPVLEEFGKRNNTELFIGGYNLSKNNLLSYLSNNKLENEEIKNDYKKIESELVYSDLDTFFNISLSLANLSKNDKISKVLISSDNINESKMKYIVNLFGVSTCNKKVYTTSNSIDFILENFDKGKITTVFVHDVDSIYENVIKNDNINKNRISFYLMDSKVNYDNETDIKYIDNIKSIMEKKSFEIKFYGTDFNNYF